QGYLYVYNTVNQIGGNDGYIPQGTIAAIGELTPNTTYYWWVASACEPQQWVQGGSFTTLPATTPTGCNPPTNMNNGLISATTAKLQWTAANPAPEGYYVTWNTVNDMDGDYGWTDGTNALLTELTPSTTYYWWIASDCEPEQWVSGGTFTTTALPTVCNPPTNAHIVTAELTPTTATVAWTGAVPMPEGYFVVWNTVNVINGSYGWIMGTEATLEDLTPNTTYYWWVASNCEPDQWVSGGTFTTPAIATCNAPT
ncbi:fibronectin type III domain-containing protein, partial [Flavobacterium suzhouense]